MWFKKKDKDYSPEEAADLTRKELAPFWFRANPLICGAMMPDGSVNPQPLDPALREGIWVLFFGEAAGSSFERAREVQKEWDRRFSSLAVRSVFCFRSRYSFLKRRRIAESWLSTNEIKGVAYSDATGLLAQAFGGESYPRLVILKEGGIFHNVAGDGWLDGAEKCLSELLRQGAPGLPLLPMFQESRAGHRDVERWIFDRNSKALDEGKVQLIGKWKREDDKIVTGDPTARIQFIAPGNEITLVAQSFTEELTPTRIFFHSQGTFFADRQAGPDFVTDEEAQSSVMVSVPRAYGILRNLEDHQRDVTLQFSNARITSVAVYALEFSQSPEKRR